MDVLKKNKKTVFIAVGCFCAILWTQRDIFTVSTSVGYRILELLYTVCMTLILTKTLLYLLMDKNDSIADRPLYECYIKLFLVQMLAFLPMYTQNFMYGDDLWGFATDFNGNLSTGLYFSRPFISFFYGILPETSFLTIRYFRIVNGMFLFGFGCILLRFIALRTQNLRLAFLISVMAVSSCTAVDCIAYASVYPINSALMISALSFVIYLEARENKGRRKFILLAESGICLFSAFCLYQIGTPIVFLFYLIAEKYGQDQKDGKRFVHAFLYLIYYGITAVAYMLINKALQIFIGVANGQAGRGQMINSLELVRDKIVWFFGNVCPQALSRLVGNVCGNALFQENNMFYQCTFAEKSIGIVLMVILTTLIICSIVITAYQKKSFVYGFIAVVAVPLAFYPFLILPESVFLTYYAMAVILLFLWYAVDGACAVIRVVVMKWNRVRKFERAGNVFLTGLVLIIALQSNYYAENVWVNYCRDSYEYLANRISSELTVRNNVDTILVNGTISPYVGGRDYVIFCVEDILRELGYSPENYHIVQSDNGYYLLSFPEGEIAGMEEVLGHERLEQVLQYYVHDDLYGRWSYNYTIQTQDEMEFLKECFEETGQLATEDEHTISVSMNGFNQRNPF